MWGQLVNCIGKKNSHFCLRSWRDTVKKKIVLKVIEERIKYLFNFEMGKDFKHITKTGSINQKKKSLDLAI